MVRQEKMASTDSRSRVLPEKMVKTELMEKMVRQENTDEMELTEKMVCQKTGEMAQMAKTVLTFGAFQKLPTSVCQK